MQNGAEALYDKYLEDKKMDYFKKKTELELMMATEFQFLKGQPREHTHKGYLKFPKEAWELESDYPSCPKDINQPYLAKR